MARPRTPIGTFGDISFDRGSGGSYRARTRYRDDDGRLRRVSATGATKRGGRAGAQEGVANRSTYRASGELTADSSFVRLVEVWLADLDLEAKLAPSTRALYERNMRQIVLPAFEGYTLREITVSRVDRYIKNLAVTQELQHGQAGPHRAEPGPRTCRPVRRAPEEPGPRHRPAAEATVAGDGAHVAQVEAIRVAVRAWRRGTVSWVHRPMASWSRSSR